MGAIPLLFSHVFPDRFVTLVPQGQEAFSK